MRLPLAIHQDVLDRAREEIRAHPHVEVGGKFVGLVEGDFRSLDRDWDRQLARLRVTVLAYLDAGPGKDRSAVHHHSDTDYQYELFQELLRDRPDLQFLGIWHSHHPNGLRTLSPGDERTGLTAVNGGHEWDFLLSSLAVDTGGLAAGRHFVFLRGHPAPREIDTAGIRVVDGPNPVAEAVETAARRLRSGRTRPQVSAMPAWTTQEAGRGLLAEDQAWFGEQLPGMRPYLREGALLWQGTAGVQGRELECAYRYPPGFPEEPPRAEIGCAEARHSFVITDLGTRHETLLHCLRTVAASLEP
ncbi:hypothetical protein [Streptomyces sp. NPDC026673]|uniref:hypothetical protein n=1 Tax=Streptomyces sp. NPDC026673 TaxID=3155724 RepID=UPI0033C8FE63